MSGFDKDKLKQAFFPDQPDWEANFICNIGHGDPASVFPRSPRLSFDEACDVI
jgi:3-hydroxypropanoate dehydrogenase